MSWWRRVGRRGFWVVGVDIKDILCDSVVLTLVVVLDNISSSLFQHDCISSIFFAANNLCDSLLDNIFRKSITDLGAVFPGGGEAGTSPDGKEQVDDPVARTAAAATVAAATLLCDAADARVEESLVRECMPRTLGRLIAAPEAKITYFYMW